MKYFVLLLMSALLVGCVGSIEKGKEAPKETNTEVEETELEARMDEDEMEDEKEEVAEEEGEVEEYVEDPTEDDDMETYVFESGTVTWSGAKVVGGGYEGTVDVIKAEATLTDDGPMLESAMFELDMTSINSGNGGLDGHLKNEDFFDVENHPTATLKLTDAKPDEAPDTYMLSGTLEILGNEEPISFLATVKEVDDKVSAQAEFEIDRTKWGITYGSGSVFDDLGDRVIKDEVGFVVDVVLAEEE